MFIRLIDENINHMKISKKVTREMIILLNHLASFLYLLGSEFLTLDASHMRKKYSFRKPCLKSILTFFCVYVCKPKHLCTIMYTCEKTSPLDELFYFGLFKFFNLNLFHINIICRK